MHDAMKKLITFAAGIAWMWMAPWASAANTPVVFQLNWMAGGPNAGFAAALVEGYYKDAASMSRSCKATARATRRSWSPTAARRLRMPTQSQ